MQCSIVIVGVGGQGTILASKVLSEAAGARGLFVRTSETIGMAQRGGSVSSHLRIGAEDLSPVVPSAHADILLAFEPAEAVRTIAKLAPNAKAVINIDKIIPTNVSLKQGKYLGDEYMALLKKIVPNALFLSGTPLAIRAGSARALNIVMLGAALGAGILPFAADEMKAAILASIKPKLADINMKAFEFGYDAARNA